MLRNEVPYPYKINIFITKIYQTFILKVTLKGDQVKPIFNTIIKNPIKLNIYKKIFVNIITGYKNYIKIKNIRKNKYIIIFSFKFSLI